MNKMKHLKPLLLALAFFTFHSVVSAQNVQSKARQQKTHKSAMDQNATTWQYSIAHVSVEDGEVTVQMERPKAEPKTEQAARAMKMQMKNASAIRAAATDFKTEIDVLNYFSLMGMELVTVLPQGSFDSTKKIYYLKSRRDN